jgi:hypothetical protein
MKIAISFFAGMAFFALIFVGMSLGLPANAKTDPQANSDNASGGLLGLLPDFEKIYNDSLTMPFIKAESKIYDPDIADYYRALMDKTGLAPRETAPQ